MKKRLYILFFGTALFYIALYTLLYNSFLNVHFPIEPAEKAFVEIETNDLKECNYLEQEAALFNFISNRLMGENGEIYSVLKGKRDNEVFAESIGLMMNYALMKDDRGLFDKELNYLKVNLLTENYLVKWKNSRVDTECNAAIDDLRVIKALLEAYGVWQNEEYLDTAGFIQLELYNKQVKAGNLYELYNWKNDSVLKRIPLCYLDAYTLDRVSMFNEGWGDVANRSVDLIKNGRLGNSSPMFYKYYDYIKGKYLLDEEYSKEKGICLTYTIYTTLHLAEVNEDTGNFTDWLKSEVDKGKLYAWYDPKTLKPAREMESTAVYALASVYADKVGERELSRRLIDMMEKFRIKDKKSPYYGGYGDENSKSFYSFDNLVALWALAEINENFCQRTI